MTLVLLVLVPTLGIVAITLQRAGRSYQETSTQQLLETANVVAQSVSSELDATSQLLSGYAALRRSTGSAANDAVDTSAFIDGQLSLTRVRRGAPDSNATNLGGSTAFADIVQTAASRNAVVVSDIVTPDPNDLSSSRIAIAVPGRTEGEDTDVISLIARPADLIRSLTRQRAPNGAVVLAITDGTGHVVGRSVSADKFIGKPVPDWKTLMALGTTNGTFKARTIEGGEVMFAFQKIGGTPGWVAVVGEPLAVFNNRWQQPIFVMMVASTTTILAAFALAMILARRILLPIRHLALRAHAIAEGGKFGEAISVEVPASFVAEFETLRQSLDGAEAALRDRLHETRLAGEASQKSYEALRQAERLARIGSWTLDLATNEFACSEMLYEINGADPAGPRLTSSDLRKLLTPESFRRTDAAMAKCVQTGEAYGMEVAHLRSDGSSFAAYVRGQAIRDEGGRIVRIAGTVQDISERQEVRERLGVLADNLPSGVIYRLERATDGSTSVTYISAGIEQLIGITAAEIVADRSVFLNAIYPEDQPGYHAAMRQSLRTGNVFDHEFRMTTRNNRLIWMHSRSALRRQPDGRMVWDGIVSDVTGEREAALVLRNAKEAAEAAERIKSDFLATMSHEIRTPMNTVVGMTRLALQTELAPKQRNYLEKIDASAKVLLGIINNILDFSKIEAGGLELEETVFTLESVLESVSTLTAIRAEEKHLEIAFAVASNTPRRLKGDSLRLGQVLTNLVGNAIKFTETGEVVVSIAPVEGTSKLQFFIRDTGIGLDAEQIRGLFQPFTQAGSDTSRIYGGTGLGLAICKRLVELMGGEIGVESTLGQGSTFFFTVTLAAVDADTSPDSISHPSSYLKNRRVLIVDDNASAREVLGDMVSEFGMATETANSGMEALAKLRSEAGRGQPFDIVLMDWRMPVMDGLETARQIRTHTSLPHMPAVLMVTAYGREEVLQGAEKIGLEGVLIKPVTQSVMFNTVLGILSRPGASRSLQDASRGPTASIPGHARFNALRGRRILVVDDNALNREVATDFLEIVDIQVKTAVNGVDALRMLELHDFDAVLMDVHMPEMDGLTAVREIRKQSRWESLPVIALTAQARVEDHNASLQAGMTAHLTKPIDEIALYRTLASVFERPAEPKISSRLVNPATDFDLSMTLQRFGGKTERVGRLLKGFLRDFAETPQQLDQYLEAADLNQIAALAHLLKGSAGYFEASELQTAAGQLEQAARQRDNEAVARHAPEFRLRLERLIVNIRNGIGELSAPESQAGVAAVPVPTAAMLDVVARAAPLVARGDYAAKALLDEISTGLRGRPDQALAEMVQAHYDELELEAAVAALSRLRSNLEALEKGTHP